MLLCCAPNRRLGKNYKVTAKIDLDGMTVNEILNPNLPFAFCVNGLQKSMEFATKYVKYIFLVFFFSFRIPQY